MTEQVEVTHSLFDKSNTWTQHDFGLDRRLIKGLSKLGYTYPTLVQSKSLPISLQGKDILVRARTGSGKTIAFALPTVQKVLENKSSADEAASIKAIVLAPTKELVKQIEKSFNDLIFYCRDFVSVYAILSDNQKAVDAKLRSKPDIIVSTPSKLAQQHQRHQVDLSSVMVLVIDEADLVLSYGYKQDVHTILGGLPKIVQGILMSATLSTELEKFKKVVLHNPAILRLEEDKSQGNLLQFYLEATESDKYLILYVFLKLGLLQVCTVRGRCAGMAVGELTRCVCCVLCAGQRTDFRQRHQQVLPAEAVSAAVFHFGGGAERTSAAQLADAHSGGVQPRRVRLFDRDGCGGGRWRRGRLR